MATGIARGARPDIVITDVVLQGETGAAIAAMLHQLSPRTRVVLMSGYSKVKVPGELVIHKPFSAQELVELVGHVLSAKTNDEAMARGRAFERSRRTH